jgi:hypothetical protein
MEAFFTEMDFLLRIFWFIALPATLIFAIQLVLTFVGTDAHDGMSADFDGDIGHDTGGPFQLFSFRNLINFFMGFGWGGIAFYEVLDSPYMVIAAATITGLAFVAMFFFLVLQLRKLVQNNTMNPNLAIGRTATVYLTIPASKAGTGKVHLNIQNTLREMLAATTGDTLPTGTLVRVTGLLEDNILIVEGVT